MTSPAPMLLRSPGKLVYELKLRIAYFFWQDRTGTNGSIISIIPVSAHTTREYVVGTGKNVSNVTVLTNSPSRAALNAL